MNRTFKIIFNRARGKMMVVNEATSSTQRGGVRKAASLITSVATAVTLGLTTFGANASSFNEIETYVSPDDPATTFTEDSNDWGKWFQSSTADKHSPAGIVTTDKNVLLKDNGSGSILISSGTTAVVNGWVDFQPDTGDGPEIILGRPAASGTNDRTGLASLIVNGDSQTSEKVNLTFDSGVVEVVNGDALISASGISFSAKGGNISVGPSGWAGYGNIKADGSERLLLGNFKNSFSDITDLDSWWNTSGKTYFAGDSSLDKLKDGDFVIQLENFPITMAGSSYLQANATPDTADGRMFVIGGTNGSISLTGSSALLTSELYLANNAQIKVAEGSHVFIGQAGRKNRPSDNDFALILGSENFKLGSADAGSDGLISVEGSTQIAGGDIYYEGTGSSPDSTGLIASGSISMADGAKLGVLSLNNAILQGAGGIDLAVDKLVMSNNAYMRGGNGSSKKSNINITADSIELTDAFIGRDGSGWKNVQGETLNTTITANTITLDSSFILGEEKVTLNTTGTNSTLTITGSAEDTEIGLRTNGEISIGSAENPFQNVTITGQGRLQADGSRTEKNLEIYAHGIFADASAGGTYGSQYTALKGLVKLHTNSINLKDDKSFINGAKGVEISSLNEEVLNIAIRNGGNLGYGAGKYETLTNYGNISGQYIDILATTGVSITGGALIASGFNEDGNSITIDGGDGNTYLHYLWTDASSVNAGKVGIFANKGYQIYIDESQIRDDIKEETNDGTLTIAINGLETESGKTGTDSDIRVHNSTISDDYIIIGSGNETIYSTSGRFVPDKSLLMNASEFTAINGSIGYRGENWTHGEITINTKKTALEGTEIISEHQNGVQLNSSESVSLTKGAHIGFNDGQTDTGNSVSIKTPSLTLDNTSYITSEGAVSIGAFDSTGNVSIAMDGTSADTEKPSWIKGQTVDISGNGIGITGGEILSTGEDGDDITISSTGNINFTNTDINAGDKGDVIINTGRGTEGSITGSNISGNTINFGGKPDQSDLDLGKIVVNGGSNISAGSNEGSSGQINIGTGVNVIVSNDGSLTANKGTDGETTSPVINVNGGKLTIAQGGEVTSEGNVDVTGGGSIDFTGNADPSTGVDAGKLVVDGNMSIGGGQSGGSINVGKDSQGIIIAENNNEDGNANLTVGTGGKVNIANGGQLFVTNNENFETPTAPSGNSGLTIDGNGTEVNIAGGTLIADKIVTEDGADLSHTMVVGSDSYLNLKDPFKDSASGKLDLSFAIEEGAEDIILDLSGSLTEEQFNKVVGELGDQGTIMVSGSASSDGTLKTPEEWAEEFGSAQVVVKDSGVDISSASDSGRDANTLTQGGASWVVGATNSPVKIEDNGNVFITGSQKPIDDKFEAVQDNDGGALAVEVTEGSSLTFGNAGSYGGNVSAGITTSDDSNTSFIGGEWNVGSLTGTGNLIIEDKSQFETGTAVDVDKDKELTANNWEMSGAHTSLTAGDAHFTGSGTLSGGANVSVGSLTVDKGLTLEGSANLNATGDSTISGGLTVEKDAAFQGTNVTVIGGDSKLHGTVNVDGNYTNTDENFSTVVTGTTNIAGSANTNDLIIGSDPFTGSGLNGSFTAGSADVGGNFVANTQSSTTINGDFTVTGSSSIASGAQVTVEGKDNEGLVNFNGGLHVSENGVFENKSPNAGTTVGDHLILEAGSNVIAGNEFKLSDTGDVSIGAVSGGNGTLNGHISASDLIDFSNANVNVTFTGENAGTDAHHIQAGANGITYADGASHVFTKDEDDSEGGIVTGVVNIGAGGSLTMNSNYLGSSDQAYLHINDSLKLANDTSKVILGDIGSTTPSNAGIYLGSGSLFDLDASGFSDGDSLITVGDQDKTGTVYLSDGSKISINNWTLGTDGTLSINLGLLDGATGPIDDFLTSDNLLYTFWYKEGELGMNLTSAEEFAPNNKFSEVVDAVLASNSENAQKQSLVSDVFSQTSGFMSQQADGSWVINELGNQRLQDVLGLPIAAGAFNIAYDAMSEMNQTMANRMAEPITAHSVSVWADVIATYNSADELFGNSGYSADIYAAVMGADVGITEDWIAGVAFTIGQGDADGEGDTMGIQNDADFYGFSVYTAKNVGQLRFSGDMGYLKLKNDISTDVNYGGKGDTDVITVGARMDMTVHQGEQFDVTPHFGIRYANFNIDTINGTATNDINVVEVPLGVTVKGKTSMNGWKVAPMVDLSVVPQFGDKKAKIWNSGVAYEQDVLDSALVKTSVGVSAQKGNFTFGLNYRLGAGNDERQNHSFNANIRYQF